MKTGIIYMLELNNKLYIGKTTDFSERIRGHKSKKPNTYIGRAINKHGWQNVQVTKLFEDVPLNDLDSLEKHSIWLMNTLVPNGYNMTLGGEGTLGYKHTDEAKQKVSEANTGRKHTEEHVRKAAEGKRGRKHSEETKKKIAESNRGKTMSSESLKKIAESKRGKPGTRTGATLSDETKEKIRNSLTGRKLSDETRRKMSEAAKKNWAKRNRKKN